MALPSVLNAPLAEIVLAILSEESDVLQGPKNVLNCVEDASFMGREAFSS